MNPTRCLLVDDEPVASRILNGYLDRIDGYEVLASCKNALEAYSFLNQHTVDLLFLDIEMPKIKGFELLKSLRTPPSVILTTAHREFALESYEFDVVDYLLKPISLQRFLRALDKYQNLKRNVSQSSSNENLDDSAYSYLKVDGMMKRLNLDEVEYIESMGNYVKIVVDKNSHIHYSSLKNILEELPCNFIQIHRSYIVNLDKIDAFNNHEIHIGKTELSITQTYRSEAVKRMEDFIQHKKLKN